MSIIIISADTREIEETIAQKVADAMDYNRLGSSILADVATKYQIDPIKLCEAMNTTPSFFKNLSSRQWRFYLACIESEVLNHLLRDNIVTWGLAAHLYVTGVSHVIKVRILSSITRGIKEVFEKRGINIQQAKKWRADELLKQKKWSLAAYNEDETDPSRYDLIINLDQIEPVEAVKTITGALEYRKFQVMTYSMKCLSDLALAAKVNVALLKSMADIKVQVRDGSVVVSTKVSKRQKRKKIESIKQLAGNIDGVNYVEVHAKRNNLKELASMPC